MHAQLPESDIKSHVQDLEEKDRVSTLLFDILSSGSQIARSQTPDILRSLQAGEDVASIARLLERTSLDAGGQRPAGCDQCKSRRRLCDAAKPVCVMCSVENLQCSYGDLSSPGSDQLGPLVPGANQLVGDVEKIRHSHNLSKSPEAQTEDAVVMQEPICSSPQALTQQIEELLREATPAFSGPSQAVGDSARANLAPAPDQLGTHNKLLNPFDYYANSTTKTYMRLFLQRVNSIFYLFDEETLEPQFATAINKSSNISNEEMSEICLVLALGAQISNDSSDNTTIMWYENGRRYLDDEDWSNSLRIMRLTALISLYHIGERPNTARHYLDSALDIGQTYFSGMRVSSPRSPEMNDYEEWLQIWTTIQFLHRYVIVNPYRIKGGS
ncbi:uncharacterized protein KY384_008076 [Bacidia gigantensis]|uniref:uncharacterized protein n=1 Tax=Bacidia gigantensis TaxID=2732470 RepID=UPI001D03E391|nr:uncharacterized protein KY384_008076 [Bacidia gigantensis]KAG8526647.1 hypothetical protein KY384_008076 [Bacidia gigantensis]